MVRDHGYRYTCSIWICVVHVCAVYMCGICVRCVPCMCDYLVSTDNPLFVSGEHIANRNMEEVKSQVQVSCTLLQWS